MSIPQRVAILGAGSRLGKSLLPLLPAAGWPETTLVVRGGSSRIPHADDLNLSVVDVDVLDETRLASALAGHDVVLSLLTPPMNDHAFQTKHTALVGAAVRAAKAAGSVERMVVVGGAGVMSLPPLWKRTTEINDPVAMGATESTGMAGRMGEQRSWAPAQDHQRLGKGDLVANTVLSRLGQALVPVYGQYQQAHLTNLHLIAKEFEDHCMICPGFMLDLPAVGGGACRAEAMVDFNTAPLRGLLGLATTFDEVAPVCVDAVRGKYPGRRVGVASRPLTTQLSRVAAGLRTHMLPLWHIR